MYNDLEGDFSSSTEIGNIEGDNSYRIGMSGTALARLGCTHISVETLSGYSAGPFAVTNLGGLDNTCTSCNCHGNDLGGGYNRFYWAGGRKCQDDVRNGVSEKKCQNWEFDQSGGCHGSKHFGLMKEGEIHVECGEGSEKDMKWGHFHRWNVNTGVYVFGDQCINENEGDETFSFYLSGCGNTSSTGTQEIKYMSWRIDGFVT